VAELQPAGFDVDAEIEAKRRRQPRERGKGGFVLAGFQPRHVGLRHPYHAAQLGLRQAAVGAVAEYLDRHVVGELGPLVLPPVVQILHVLLVDLAGGAQV
jgi:hypothetical protein